MVEWKGELSDKSGNKARRLENVSGFSVPNFFVITSEELDKLVKGEKDYRKIAEIDLDSGKLKEIKDAYREVDMSSEIRNASGRARNLVGGQRDGSRVSIRVAEEGFQDYMLNVGSSELEDALRNVIGSHLEKNDELPSIMVQKMIEPEMSGAAIKKRDQIIVEAVKGYGTSLEEGKTSPDLYRIGDTIESKIPERQLEASLNPMTGDIREKEVRRNAPLLKETQLRHLAEKMSKEQYSVKFAYKRGTFYVVDAFKAPDVTVTPEMDGIKVSQGEIDGKPGQDFVNVNQPKEPEKPMIAEKGGATSRSAAKAREKDIPAIFNFSGEFENGDEQDVEEEVPVQSFESTTTATRVLAADRHLPGKLETEFGIDFNESYVENADQILESQENSTVIDLRRIGEAKGLRALELVDTEFQSVIIDRPETDLVEKLVQQGVEAIASENETERLESLVKRHERKMIVDAAREILNSRD